MGIETPQSIKVKVIDEWIQGISRAKIALNNDIGAETVTSILQEDKISYPHYNIDLIRELALKMKKENLDLNYFASSVRLKKSIGSIRNIRRKCGIIS